MRQAQAEKATLNTPVVPGGGLAAHEASVGVAGLEATYEAVKAGKTVGLANKDFNADEVLDRRSSAMGNASDAIGFVESMADAGIDECYFVLQLGSFPKELVLESIRQIGEKVIPHFRGPARQVIDLAARPVLDRS